MEDRELLDREEQYLNSKEGRGTFFDQSWSTNDQIATWLLAHNVFSKIVCYSVVDH